MHAGHNERPRLSSCTVRTVPLAVGLAAAVAQIVLMREVIALFNGNELSLGSLLAVWLAMTAMGSGLVNRVIPRRANLRRAIVAGECLSSMSLPFAIWLLRVARAYLQTVPGELLGPIPLTVASFVSLSGFCIVSGCLFALAAGLYRQESATPMHQATSSSYLLETAGFALGGILACLLLLGFFSSFQIALLVSLLNLSVACWLGFRPKRLQMAAILTAATLVAVLLVRVAPRVEQATQQRIWAGFHITGSAESIYGKLVVLEASGLRTIYEDGAVLANVPDPAQAEETVHYALLEHPAPRNVLLIGNGINGSIAEALKHPTIERLDYVELDPALIDIYRRLFPAEFGRAFFDTRVNLHLVDGRLYLKSAGRVFDVVVVSVPDPENAQLNRYYTSEFFQSVRDHLAPGGTLALQMPASEDSIGPDLADFLRCIHRTLHNVFPHVVVIPGESIHMFGAMHDGVLTDDPQVLVTRLKQRNLQTQYVQEYFIPFRMMPDRMSQIDELLRPLPATPVNRDFEPVAYYFGTVLWGTQFRSGYARVLEVAAGLPRAAIIRAGCVLSLLLATVWALAPKTRVRFAAAWSVLATGYTLMALQILLLLAFQSVCGYVYHNLALLVGTFMAGMALGCVLAIRRVRRCEGKQLMQAAAINQFFLAAAAPLLLVMATQMARGSAASGSTALTQVAFSVMALLCGLPGGYQFPVASALYQCAGSRQQNTGTLYALDLVGGCLGALFLAGFLIPLFGFWTTAWTATLVSGTPAAIASVAWFSSAADSV